MNSLLRWLVYWAIGTAFYKHISSIALLLAGFQQSLDYYAEKITETLQDLHSFALVVIPPNRSIVKEYISCTELRLVDMLLASIKQACASINHSDDVYMSKFSDYVKKQEDDLGENLEKIRFEIDSLDTVTIVTGPGRLEQVSRTTITPYIIILTRLISTCFQ